MHVEEEEGSLSVKAETYILAFAVDRPFVYLDDPSGCRIAELFVLSSVHPLHDRDDTVGVGRWRWEESPGEIVFSLEVASSVWQSKIYRFRCRPRRFLYEIEIVGEGRLAEAHYFGGYFSGQARWGSGFFRSGQSFRRGFNPEPNSQEVNYFVPSAGSVIDLTGVPLPGKAGWFFTPPPFCYAFLANQGWLGVGVEAAPGANRYTEFSYSGELNSFYLTLAYEGHTSVAGRYRLPALGFDFGDDEYDVLRAHVRALGLGGHLGPARARVKPAWWHEPIFCGWGAQCGAAVLEGGRAPDYGRQALYESVLATLEQNGVCPGIVVLDDKWQATYGDNLVDPAKWPDLRGFVRNQHSLGRRVLLWLKAWDPEGLPAEECISNAAGLTLAVDPTNPAYVHRLCASIKTMLGPDGYDADGFKIDFSARIPSGPGMHLHGDTWGLELMHTYLGVLHDEAKRIKPEALIMAHTPHPYLSGLLDMIRLNDINVDKNVGRAMTLRARIAAIACPDALIDTDNWPIRDKAAWRAYTSLQLSLGIPSLYYGSHIDSTGELLEEEDYALLRDTWAEYRASQA